MHLVVYSSNPHKQHIIDRNNKPRSDYIKIKTIVKYVVEIFLLFQHLNELIIKKIFGIMRDEVGKL